MNQHATRRVVHPGPVAKERIEAIACRAEAFEVTLAPGIDMNASIADAFASRGFSGGFLRLKNAMVDPMRYVIPAPAPDAEHAAWYSETFAPEGEAIIEDAGFIVGRRDDQPFFHCHGVWETSDLGRRAGHLLPHDSRLSKPARAQAWGVSGDVFEVLDDRETNFRLFTPRPSKEENSAGCRAVIARVRPGEEIGQAIEALCRQHDMLHATVMGIGSVVGAVFTDAPDVSSYATEALITDGKVTDGTCRLDIAIVGIDGCITEGRLAPGINPVCVTFELLIVGDK